jgi:hypothetical protein
MKLDLRQKLQVIQDALYLAGFFSDKERGSNAAPKEF